METSGNVEGSQMLICDHYLLPDPYNPIVEGHLWETGFYHVSHIGVVQCQSALVNALIERWRPETHTFHFPIGECSVTLEDVAVIFGLPTNSIPVTGPTLSSYEALEVECLHHFGVAPRKTECRGSFVKLTWFRRLKDHLVLDNDIQIQRIREFSWGLACLAHLYRALCRATRVDCKEIDGPLTLLLTWAWIRLPFLSPIPGNPRVFLLANRWRNWDRDERPYRYHSLAHYRRVLDDLQEGQFVWEAYAVDRIEAGVIPADIHHHSVIWSATMPLISFECIEWHASDRLRRQFGLSQGVPHQVRDLGDAHGEVLTGPKNEDWSDVHSFWVMQWTNRYSHILADPLVPLHNPLDIYMQWYRGIYGAHLQLTDLAIQENQEGHPADHQENQQQQTDPLHPAPPPPPPPVSQPETQEAPQSYIPQTQPADYFTPSVPLHQQYWGVPHFD
ncbi:serine/threonine-protein phosphatase 7 long form homolog [Arachis hypogaea]|uniref:serine/threonine-protein phosphatase 7 long form homolog n=1 Tax=Arachis hypogaea TaxID=3818 RepID=UPI003B227613